MADTDMVQSFICESPLIFLTNPAVISGLNNIVNIQRNQEGPWVNSIKSPGNSSVAVWVPKNPKYSETEITILPYIVTFNKPFNIQEFIGKIVKWKNCMLHIKPFNIAQGTKMYEYPKGHGQAPVAEPKQGLAALQSSQYRGVGGMSGIAQIIKNDNKFTANFKTEQGTPLRAYGKTPDEVHGIVKKKIEETGGVQLTAE